MGPLRLGFPAEFAGVGDLAREACFTGSLLWNGKNGEEWCSPIDCLTGRGHSMGIPEAILESSSETILHGNGLGAEFSPPLQLRSPRIVGLPGLHHVAGSRIATVLSRLCPLNSSRQSPRLWLLLWVLALVPWPVHAEDVVLTWAEKMFAERAYDFGSPLVGAEASHSIKISNLYKETVTISEVSSTSPDIRARVSRTTLPSAETAQLDLSLDAAALGKSNGAIVTLKLTFDGVNFKTVTVPVKASPPAGIAVAPPIRNIQAGGNWAEKMFSELKYDFVSVARGAEAKHVIEITNLYKEDVTLSNLASSCGCITTQLDNFLIKSKQTAQLVIVLDTVRFSKRRDVTVSLSATFDQLNFKQIRIPITAYIRSDVVFDPGSVHFGVVAPGEEAERRVRVIYAGRDGWTVRSTVRGANPHLTSTVKELSRGNGRVEYELLVKLAGTAPPGQILDQLVLQTDDAANPTIPVLVDGSVEADLQITPGVVPFGILKPGVEKVVNVVVKGRKPFRIEKVECDSARDCFGVSPLVPLEKTVHVISLKITPPDQPGDFKESFSVTIAGRQAPLSFQAVGTIEAPAAPPGETDAAPKSNIKPLPGDVPATDVSPDPAAGSVPAEGEKPSPPE